MSPLASGTLTAPIGKFGAPGQGPAAAFKRCFIFFPNGAPFGFVPPPGTTDLTVDTLDPQNTGLDTGVEIFKRPGLASVGFNDRADPDTTLSRCSIKILPAANYRFGLYVRGDVPADAILVLNFRFF